MKKLVLKKEVVERLSAPESANLKGGTASGPCMQSLIPRLCLQTNPGETCLESCVNQCYTGRNTCVEGPNLSCFCVEM